MLRRPWRQKALRTRIRWRSSGGSLTVPRWTLLLSAPTCLPTPVLALLAATVKLFCSQGSCCAVRLLFRVKTAKDTASRKPRNQVLAVKRIHKRMGAPLEVLPTVRNALKALVKAYVALNGIHELLPKRKEPLTNVIIGKILALPAGTKVGARVLDWDDPFFVVFKAILCTGLSAGFRKAEMCMAADADFDYTTISRANITWIIKGVPVASPTEAQLLALTDGDYCGIMPAACKNDPFGLHFAWKPIWLPVHGAPTNAARALAAMLISVPVSGAAAATTPLFSLSSQGDPVRHRVADSTLRFFLNAALPGEDTTRWSSHLKYHLDPAAWVHPGELNAMKNCVRCNGGLVILSSEVIVRHIALLSPFDRTHGRVGGRKVGQVT